MDVSGKMALLVLGSHAPSSHSCAQSVPELTYCQFMVARSDWLQWKSAWRRTWALPTKWPCWFWDGTRRVRNFAQSTQERTYLQFIMAGSERLQWKWVWRRTWTLPMKCHYRAASIIRRKKCLNALLCSLCCYKKGRIAMKMGMKEDMAVADKMALLVFGLCVGIIAR